MEYSTEIKNDSAKASALCSFAEKDISNFVSVFKSLKIDNIVWDSELKTVDVAIYLRRANMLSDSIAVCEHARTIFPHSHLLLYEAAIASGLLMCFDDAIRYAEAAYHLQPKAISVCSLLVRAYCINGQTDKARFLLDGFYAQDIEQAEYLSVLSQFAEFCEKNHVSRVYSCLADLVDSAAYLGVDDIGRSIIAKIKDRKPISLVRLGDGEGAWLRFGGYDEGRFSSLYAAGRRSFLKDWFGTDDLFRSDEFYGFALEIQNSFRDHDFIGIPPSIRLNQERSFLSMRGIYSAVNVFRHLDLLHKRPRKDVLLCSNSINLELSSSGFYRQLFEQVKEIGVISSQKALPGILSSIGVNVDPFYIVPGDSRNFHLNGENGAPDCQYPHYVNQIDAVLQKSDLSGKIFLVAAGFVGKKYLKTIKDRGGTAIDIGSIADHWCRSGL